jgi:hypothetical protein
VKNQDREDPRPRTTETGSWFLVQALGHRASRTEPGRARTGRRAPGEITEREVLERDLKKIWRSTREWIEERETAPGALLRGAHENIQNQACGKRRLGHAEHEDWSRTSGRETKTGLQAPTLRSHQQTQEKNDIQAVLSIGRK